MHQVSYIYSNNQNIVEVLNVQNVHFPTSNTMKEEEREMEEEVEEREMDISHDLWRREDT